MTDIVERLRCDLASGLSASIGDTKEAADEIERLRAALRVYACNGDCANCYGEVRDTQYCGHIARTALKEGER